VTYQGAPGSYDTVVLYNLDVNTGPGTVTTIAPPLQPGSTSTTSGKVYGANSDQNPTATIYTTIPFGQAPYTQTMHGQGTNSILIAVHPPVATVTPTTTTATTPATTTFVTAITPTPATPSTTNPVLPTYTPFTYTPPTPICQTVTNPPATLTMTSTIPGPCCQPPATATATILNPIPLPWVPCGALNHKGNTFYLRTHVLFGDPQFENLYFQATRGGKLVPHAMPRALY
jgi:hypothetical protein